MYSSIEVVVDAKVIKMPQFNIMAPISSIFYTAGITPPQSYLIDIFSREAQPEEPVVAEGASKAGQVVAGIILRRLREHRLYEHRGDHHSRTAERYRRRHSIEGHG